MVDGGPRRVVHVSLEDPLISIADARRLLLTHCTALAPCRVALDQAEGCVLAEPVFAVQPIPPFDNSAMDGYALRAIDTYAPPARLRVLETVMAGAVPRSTLTEGESTRIMTGAPLPAGADAVCVVERTRCEEDGAWVVIDDAVDVGANVRRAGEDVARGSEVFAPGTCLGAAHMAVLATLGAESVVVHPRPVVGVLSTGDEIEVGCGPLPPGKIRDANRPALLAQLRSDGFTATDLGVVGDDEARDRSPAGCLVTLRGRSHQRRGEQR